MVMRRKTLMKIALAKLDGEQNIRKENERIHRFHLIYKCKIYSFLDIRNGNKRSQ